MTYLKSDSLREIFHENRIPDKHVFVEESYRLMSKIQSPQDDLVTERLRISTFQINDTIFIYILNHTDKSVTLTNIYQNSDYRDPDEFVEFMIEKGCVLGWYFMYVPIGREPNLEWMPTPEQRGYQFERLTYHRATKPILLADFWNDGPVVGGCISAGRKYFHVNAHGDVEPCVFCHFATHNIRTSDLKDAVNSALFKCISCQLPSYENLLRPCVIIDKPEISRNAIFEHNAYFTHEGAEIVYEHLAHEIDEYAQRYGEIADELWNKYFKNKEA